MEHDIDGGPLLDAVLATFAGPGFLIDEEGRYRQVFTGTQNEGLLYDDPERLEGKRFHDVLPDDTADRFLDAVQRALSAGEPRSLEYDLDVPAGQRWFDATVIPVDGPTPAEVVVWVAYDVTDRKRQQRRLRHQKATIEALHDVATDIETCETPDDVYELLVEAAESVLEFDIAIADEAADDVLIPRAVSSSISGDQYYERTPVDADDNLAAEVYRTGDPSLVAELSEAGVAPADPTFRSALTVPIGDHGVFQSVARSAGAFDEADLELVETLVAHASARLDQLARERELERQNDRLDEFASIVSHDLRTPLSVAKGNLQRAREETSSEYHEEVGDALDRMERLIDDLLTLARRGDDVDDLEVVSLDTLVESCWGAVSSPSASLVVEADGLVYADRQRLRQLLENVLGNAVEHGGPDVTIRVGWLGDEEGFFVADDGPGIPGGVGERVFESGYSAAGGTGLGLAIVETIATAHGWEVTVTDSESGGARFDVRGVDVVG